jgi:hypothetical protein
MHPTPNLGLYRVQLGALLLARDPLELEPPAPVLPQMCVRPWKSNVSGLETPTTESVSGGEPSELDQPRLLRMQLQPELREPVAKISQEPLGVLTVLKARHVVINHQRTAKRSRPLARCADATVGPQVTDVVQVDLVSGSSGLDPAHRARPAVTAAPSAAG